MVSIVGPQNVEKRLHSFTKNLVTKIYDEERTLVSSGLKGIDAYALKVHLQLGGKAVCFVSDHMFDKKKTYAKPIREGKLVLMSAVDPFAYFNVTNALDRNIYVCGLSELQFITASHINSGVCGLPLFKISIITGLSNWYWMMIGIMEILDCLKWERLK